MNEQKTCPKNIYIRLFIIFSVVLNLFFIGSAVGIYVYRYQIAKFPPERMYDAVHVLNQQDQEKMLTILDHRVPIIEDQFFHMFSIFKKFKARLTAEDLTNEDLAQMREAMVDGHTKMAKLFVTILTDINETLPPKERVKFLEAALPSFPPFIPEPLGKEMEEKHKNMKVKK